MTLVELILGFSLACGFLSFSITAYTYLTRRATATTQATERARRAALLLERLRRILRAASQVARVPGGFEVAWWGAADGAAPRWNRTRVTLDAAGRVQLWSPRGGTHTFELGEEVEGDLELVEEDGLLQPHVPGLHELGVGLRIRPLQPTRGPRLVASIDVERLGEPVAGWVLPSSPPEGASARVSEAPSTPPPPRVDGEVAAPHQGLTGGLDTEVDSLGPGLRPMGQVLLPQAPAPGLPLTPYAEVLAALTGGLGLAGEEAWRGASAIRSWEASVRRGDRRGAAEALTVVEHVLREGGVAEDQLLEATADASRAAASLRDAAPPGLVSGGEPPRVTASLLAGASPSQPPAVTQVEPDDVPWVGGDPYAGTDPTTDGTDEQDPPPPPADVPAAPAPPEPAGTPLAKAGDVALMEWSIVEPPGGARVGDEVEVSFVYRNDGTQPISFGNSGIFVGARWNSTTDSNNRDFGKQDAGRTVEPGETMTLTARKVMDAAGTWRFWPAFQKPDGGWGPFRWQERTVEVRP